MRLGSLHDDVEAGGGLVLQLLAMSFATGALDSFSIASYMCFLANQTGNSILVYVGAFGLLENHQRFINVCISLGCFLVSCMLGGQLGNHFGRRRRWWLLLSHSYQTGAIILVCILLGVGAIDRTRPSRIASIVLLSSSSGFQVALARSSGILEVTTVMRYTPVTTPYGDLLVDRELFKLGWSKSRDRRLLHIFAMWTGGAVGAAMFKYKSEPSPCYLAAAIKTVVTIMFLFLPAKQNPNHPDGSRSTPADPCKGDTTQDSKKTSQAVNNGPSGQDVRALNVARSA